MKKEYVLLGILSAAFVAAGIWISQTLHEYRAAGQEYEELKEYVREVPEEETSGDTGNKEGKGEESGEGEFTVDFEALKEINPDIVAWLKIPGVLDYPVVQGTDNSYYLSHTFRGQYNIAGSIFLDSRNKADFSDSRSIIYGHNMKDGSMFHVLRKFQDWEFYKENREIWLYLPDGSVRVYEIVECEEVEAAGDTYELGTGKKDAKELILSTCSAKADRRVVVRGKEEVKGSQQLSRQYE
ncbi:class B sortase [Mediterraneibacter glycyrrhizinilyticus]|nr:class B sortase [Mediterraneibacter glycyrrhizinilyticus]MBM6801848.1 class B sortase [Mediterraneibacter glycyrrhizinilyticus]